MKKKKRVMVASRMLESASTPHKYLPRSSSNLKKYKLQSTNNK